MLGLLVVLSIVGADFAVSKTAIRGNGKKLKQAMKIIGRICPGLQTGYVVGPARATTFTAAKNRQLMEPLSNRLKKQFGLNAGVEIAFGDLQLPTEYGPTRVRGRNVILLGIDGKSNGVLVISGRYAYSLCEFTPPKNPLEPTQIKSNMNVNFLR